MITKFANPIYSKTKPKILYRILGFVDSPQKYVLQYKNEFSRIPYGTHRLAGGFVIQ